MIKGAADNNNINACRDYGIMAIQGIGVPKNVKEGLHYLTFVGINK